MTRYSENFTVIIIWMFFTIPMILGAFEEKLDTFTYCLYGLVILYITYLYKLN
jgi:hypothetical protein